MVISCLDLLRFEIKQENLIFHGLCKCLYLSLQLKRKEKRAKVQHSGEGIEVITYTKNLEGLNQFFMRTMCIKMIDNWCEAVSSAV